MIWRLENYREALAPRYQIQRELGRGGMARVFLAEDLRRKTDVAVKVLNPEVARILGPQRFRREIEILGRLSHPNIVPILDSDHAGSLLYLVMPFIAGSSLKARLEREGELPLDDVVAITRDAAAAIDFAHAQDVLHRDIKPANILLSGEAALICDFGLARAINQAAREPVSSSGLVLGTPAYMSPEQAAGQSNLDRRSDIYALGCVVYEMLTGEQPFTGATSQAIIARQISEPPRSIRTVRREVPRPMEEGILSALAKDPADRPESGAELMRRMAS